MFRTLTLATTLTIFLSMPNAEAKIQKMITGSNPEEIQENAFKQKMDYPVGPLKCDQRCSQWWERQ
jgi:hypothetical protein